MSKTQAPAILRTLSFWFDHSEGMKRGLVAQARNHELETWRSTADGSLALTILLDQMPRNIFRGSSETYASDAQAVEVSIGAVAQGFDQQVPLDRQMFFYLPFMHAENMLSQVASLGLYQGLLSRMDKDSELAMTSKVGLQMSQRHMDVIRRFGRYPSRNKIMGRESTEEELKFLEETPHGF